MAGWKWLTQAEKRTQESSLWDNLKAKIIAPLEQTWQAADDSQSGSFFGTVSNIARFGQGLSDATADPPIPGNIDVSGLPQVPNPDGSVSTVRSISAGVDGREVLLPTVVDGRVVSNDAAIRHYQDTGRNLGSFGSPDAADAYALLLHMAEANRIAKKDDGGFFGALRKTGSDLIHTPLDVGADIRDAATGGSLTDRLGDVVDATGPGRNLLGNIGKVDTALGQNISGPVFNSFLDQQGQVDTDPWEAIKNTVHASILANPVARLGQGAIQGFGDNGISGILPGAAGSYGDQGAQDFARFQQSNAPEGLKVAANFATPGAFLGGGEVAGTRSVLGGLAGAGVAGQLGQDAPEWAQGPLAIGGAIVGGAIAHNPQGALNFVKKIEAPISGERGSFDMGQIGKVPDSTGGAGGVSSPPPPARTFGARDLDPSALISRAYGSLPFLKKDGIGGLHHSLVDAPDAYEAASLIPLKDNIVTNPRLPATAKVSNAVWGVLNKVSGDRFATKLDDARVRQIALNHRAVDEMIPQVTTSLVKLHAEPLRQLEVGPMGEALVGGKPVRYIGAELRPESKAITATWQDIREHPERYQNVMDSLSPEVRTAWDKVSDIQDSLLQTSKAMGIKVEGAADVGPTGRYSPRLGTRSFTREETPTVRLGRQFEDAKAGSSLERRFKSGADAIATGYRVPDPYEAFATFVEQNLRDQNGTHAGTLLKQITLEDGKTIGAGVLPTATKDELGTLRGQIRPMSRELAKFKTLKSVADRDARLNARFINSANERGAQLFQKIQDASLSAEERSTAAHEALTTAKQQLADSLSAAMEFEKKSARAAVEGEASRTALKNVLDEGSALSKRLDAIEDEAFGKQALNDFVGPGKTNRGVTYDAAGNPTVTNLGPYLRGVAAEAQKALDYSQTVRETAATESARIMKRLESLPVDDVQARHASALEAVADANVRFRGSLSSAKRAAIDAQAAAASEPALAEKMRQAYRTGQANELSRIVRQRGNQVRDAVGRQTVLGQHIEDLKAQLEPIQTRRKELLQQVNEVRSVARDRKMEFNGEVALNSMRGVPVPAELANAWNKYLRQPTGTVGQLFDIVNNAFRSLGATADVSRSGSVGLLGLADNPSISARGIGTAFREIKTEDAMWQHLRQLEQRNVAKGLPSLTDAYGKHGLMLAESELSFGSNAKIGGLQERLSTLPVLKQADTLYSVPGNVERAERFYHYLGQRKLQGLDYTSPQAQEAAANAANLISGRARHGVLSPVMGETASGRVLFAGRFVQSQLDTVGNAVMSGGIEGYEARKALIRLVGGAAGLTYAINTAMGQPTSFDPGDPNFLRIRLLGKDYSLLGPWDSLGRGVWNSSKTAIEQGNNARTDTSSPGALASDVRGIATAPTDLTRSKLGPVPSMVSNQMFNGGKDIQGNTVLGPASLPVPFGVRDIAGQVGRTDFSDPTSIGALGLASGASLLGVKSAPMTPAEVLDARAQEMFPGTDGFYSLPSKADQDAVKKAYPEEWKDVVANGSVERIKYEKAKADYITAQGESDKILKSGGMDTTKWIKDYKDRQSDLAAKSEVFFPDKITKPRNPHEAYMQKIQQSQGADGTVDWNSVDGVDAWVAAQSPADQKYIADHAGLPWTPVVAEYMAASKVRNQMYKIPEYVGVSADDGSAVNAAMKTINKMLPPKAPVSQQLQALAKIAETLTPSQKQAAVAAIYGTLQTSPARAQYKKAHPELEKWFTPGALVP